MQGHAGRPDHPQDPADTPWSRIKPWLDVLPAHVFAAAAELELFSALNRERQLQNCLDGIRGKYDFVILDCPPSLGLITINALTAATDVLIPVEPGRFSIVGLAQLLKTIDMLKEGARPVNPDLNLFGVVLMKADNTSLTTLTARQLEENFGDKVLPSVPSRSAVRDSQYKVTDLIGHVGLGREAESGALNAFIRDRRQDGKQRLRPQPCQKDPHDEQGSQTR